MTNSEALREAICRERQRRETFVRDTSNGFETAPPWALELGSEDEVQAAVQHLLYFTPPQGFLSLVSLLRREIRNRFDVADEWLQGHFLRLLAGLVLAHRSFLPRWNLQNAERHGGAILSNEQLAAEANHLQSLAVELAAEVPKLTGQLLAGWKAEARLRLEAEAAENPESVADQLVGDSIGAYLDNLCTELAESNLRRVGHMRAAGQTQTEISNDYAAFLQYTLYLGASFATCNPPLVDRAWVSDPERWGPVVEDVIAANPNADADELAALVTLEVVLSNMRLLRPIFLLTGGKMGCVCFQVNPNQHDDATPMIADAQFIYEHMRHKLEGGVPNVVFKLPGTWAGLQACRALTGQGIGVTITVNFGLFQHLPFARAIHQGQSLFSCLVEMNGRLAYPVRDELLGKLDQLAAHGTDEARAREAAAWSGVAVLKRLRRLLDEKDYDLRRVKPLVASLRIYRGDGYEHLPSAFPDITEVLGPGIISVFPNVRRAFDVQPEIELDPCRIEAPVPDHILEVLTHSEIFKQAYYVGDRDWMPDEDERFRPEYELTLEDEAGTAAWPPVHNTLTEFCNSYDTFVQRILELRDERYSSESRKRLKTTDCND